MYDRQQNPVCRANDQAFTSRGMPFGVAKEGDHPERERRCDEAPPPQPNDQEGIGRNGNGDEGPTLAVDGNSQKQSMTWEPKGEPRGPSPIR